MDLPLETRMEALAEWLQGFLGGFGMVHSASTKASDEVKELITDFASIAQLDVDGGDDSNEAERQKTKEYTNTVDDRIQLLQETIERALVDNKIDETPSAV